MWISFPLTNGFNISENMVIAALEEEYISLFLMNAEPEALFIITPHSY